MPCDTGEHAWANLVPVMESKDVIRKSGPVQDAMRSGLALNGPAKSHEYSKDTIGL
jgi:hypothetical protein